MVTQCPGNEVLGRDPTDISIDEGPDDVIRSHDVMNAHIADVTVVKGKTTKEKLTAQFFLDLHKDTPVTDYSTRLTYLNKEVFMCFGKVNRNVSFWGIAFKPGYFKIPYNQNLKEADVLKQMLSSEYRYVSYNQLRHNPSACLPSSENLTETCDVSDTTNGFFEYSYDDNNTEYSISKCRTFSSFVTTGSKVYKNRYCALCNMLNGSDISPMIFHEDLEKRFPVLVEIKGEPKRLHLKLLNPPNVTWRTSICDIESMNCEIATCQHGFSQRFSGLCARLETALFSIPYDSLLFEKDQINEMKDFFLCYLKHILDVDYHQPKYWAEPFIFNETSKDGSILKMVGFLLFFRNSRAHGLLLEDDEVMLLKLYMNMIRAVKLYQNYRRNILVMRVTNPIKMTSNESDFENPDFFMERIIIKRQRDLEVRLSEILAKLKLEKMPAKIIKSNIISFCFCSGTIEVNFECPLLCFSDGFYEKNMEDAGSGECLGEKSQEIDTRNRNKENVENGYQKTTSENHELLYLICGIYICFLM